jgi:hypothetical protein
MEMNCKGAEQTTDGAEGMAAGVHRKGDLVGLSREEKRSLMVFLIFLLPFFVFSYFVLKPS